MQRTECVAVVGAGSWGTALAYLLGDKGTTVWLWGRNAVQMATMARTRQNPRYLPDVHLPETVHPTSDLEPLQQCQVIVLAVPSGALRSTMERLPKTDAPCVIATKGLEPQTGKLLTEVAQEALGVPPEQVVVLSGPNLAVELVRGIPTATVASSVSTPTAERIQELFMTPTLRVYTNDDVVGVELGGALKNVYAIGSGLSDGLGFGDNTKGTLLTRGLAEMMRFGVAMGACPETFVGLTGVGDLFATAVSRLSRNYRLGRAVASGKTAEQALAELGQVAEGYPTALVAKRRAEALGVEMPLLSAIADILSGERAVQEALHSLMTRPPRDEREFRFVRR
ncbi:MAG: NAD(P)H-dependent glycerol-3-phosphate dehydrogenase [Fimbriimonadales bacterium]